MLDKRVDKVIDISMASNRMIAIKVLVQRIVILVISVYSLQYSLSDRYKDSFDDSFINVIIKLLQRKLAVIAGDFNGLVKSNAEDYEEKLEGHGYRCW